MKELSKLRQKTNLEQILSYLLLFFLPTQFGKHFWLSFSFVQGLRIDYLSPTLYVTDILIGLLFLFSFRRFISFSSSLYKKYRRFSLFILISLIVSLTFSISPLLGLYGLFKYVECFFFGWYMGSFIFSHKEQSLMIFSLGVLCEGVLGLLQLIHQGSLGGLFYFLGERLFSAETPGIANASVHGELLLRPYATFSHPNVFAAYLLIYMTFICGFFHIKSFFKRSIVSLSLFIGTIALFSTLSRVAILLWILTAFSFFFYKVRLRNKRTFFIASFVISCLLLVSCTSTLFYRFSSLHLADESVQMRLSLLHAAWLMLFQHPFFGVGFFHFLPNLPLVDKSAISAFSIQPVHNVFLLFACEVGIPLFLLMLLGLCLLVKKQVCLFLSGNTVDKPYVFLSLVLLVQLILLGSFDHFFLTIQQGQLLLSLIVGFCFLIAWREIISKNDKK